MKKFLSLVLALVMTMSLVTISAGAKDFTDSDKVNYDEAVQVISLLGVVNGYEDGTFKPANTLTRGAAAKIICNLLLTPAVADTLPANNTGFKDVPSTNVFAKYIAYCANAKIINGYSDGTFRPAATLTGFAFMKMLMGALGYDAQIEGFTGDTFALNVATKVGELKLAKGNDAFVGTKAVTREEAALYAFNMLNAEMVKYASKGTKITVNGVEIIQGASPATGTGSTFAATKFSGLKEGNDADGFGRNYKTWTYKGTTVKLLESKADKIYYGDVTAKKIYSDLKLSPSTTYQVKVYPAKDYTDMTGTAIYNWKASQEANAKAKVFGGLSYMVEAYYTAATKNDKGETVNAKVDIIPVQYQLGVVTRVNKASGLDPRTVAISTTANGVKGLTAKGTYETDSFAKGDVVLFTYTDSIQSVQLAKSVEGKVVEVKGNTLTIGTTKYDSTIAKDLNTEGTFFLSVDNSIVGFNGKDVVSYGNYAYIYSIVAEKTTDNDGLTTNANRAYYVTADGTKGNAIIAKDAKGDDVIGDTGVYAYKINSDGELEEATADEKTIASGKTFTAATDNITIGKETNKVVIGANSFYMGNDTKFVFVDKSNNKLTVSTIDGYKNVEKMTKAQVVVIGNGDATKHTADAKVVFVAAKAVSASTDAKYAFLLDAEPTAKMENGKEIFVYSVMIDGDNTATLIASSESKMAGIAEKDRFEYTLKDGKLDTVNKSTAVTGTVNKAGNGYLDLAGETNTIDLDKDCVVYEYDSVANTYATGVSVADGDTVNYYMNEKGDAIAMIVITAHAD